ncbi:MAG TPA: GNAT family N-acetyltransferase [Alphaproteobacteria bacterium]|nr:GNAT family N-acetyltransferase [Alphaproteobacteria bacterium]
MSGKIAYEIEKGLTPNEFVDVLRRSGLAERRPVDEPDRIAKMLEHGNLIITAREGGKLVGVARSLSDFTYCTYLSDLAVDREYQRQGIGRALIDKTREAVGDSMVLLLSAPKAMTYYPHIGMPKAENAFMYPRRR